MFSFKFQRLLVSISASLLTSICASHAEVVYEEFCQVGKSIGAPVCKWQDPRVTKPRAALVLIHGLTQHAHSLHGLAESFVAQGYVVFGITQRGHGVWHRPERKGLPGYNCDFKRSVSDVDKLNSALKQQDPRLPIYMIGESVGAAVALRSAAGASSDMVDGIVLCSCGTKKMHFKNKWLLQDVFSSWFRPWRQINTARYQIEYACENRAVVEKTLEDPRARPTLSGIEILKARGFISKNAKYAQRLDPDLSLLVVQGECDRTIDGGSARKVFEKAAPKNKSLVIVPGAGHMLIGRPEINPTVTSSIALWLDKETWPDSLASKTAIISH